MLERGDYVPEEAQNFKFPENKPARPENLTQHEKDRSALIDRLSKEAQNFLVNEMAGKKMGTVKVLGGGNRSPLHYTNKNAVWTTPLDSENGSIVNIGELAFTTEGKALMKKFFEDHEVEDVSIQDAITNRIGKLTKF